MTDTYILKRRDFKPTDRRLGRKVAHDSRSLRFLAPASDPSKLASVRHHINIGLMDQGNEGSCTGHGGLNVAAGDAFWQATKPALGDEDPHLYARDLYAAATVIDSWPGQFEPDDTGSDGLSVAKVLQSRGLISGYVHATSLNATLTALAERPVMVGTSWLQNMENVGPDGHMDVSGPVAGGHEYCLDELDVERKRAWIRNSWGPSWGIEGRAWMTWDELGALLADDGDCTVLVPLSQPAPQPAPVPAPTPAPAPAPTPGGPSSEATELAAALKRWLGTSSAGPSYLRTHALAWLKVFPKERAP